LIDKCNAVDDRNALADHSRTILACTCPYRNRHHRGVSSHSLQLPVEIEVPGEPFLLYFIIVSLSSTCFGRTLGFFTAGATTIACILYFEPVFSFRLHHAVDLLAIEAYGVGATGAVEACCRLIDSALAERSEAVSARLEHREAQARVAKPQPLRPMSPTAKGIFRQYRSRFDRRKAQWQTAGPPSTAERPKTRLAG
jgi:hypothetical protein